MKKIFLIMILVIFSAVAIGRDPFECGKKQVCINIWNKERAKMLSFDLFSDECKSYSISPNNPPYNTSDYIHIYCNVKPHVKKVNGHLLVFAKTTPHERVCYFKVPLNCHLNTSGNENKNKYECYQQALEINCLSSFLKISDPVVGANTIGVKIAKP